MGTNNLITRKEAAAILGLKPHTLFFWEKRGLLKPFTKVNGRPRYTVADLAEAATANNNFETKK